MSYRVTHSFSLSTSVVRYRVCLCFDFKWASQRTYDPQGHSPGGTEPALYRYKKSRKRARFIFPLEHILKPYLTDLIGHALRARVKIEEACLSFRNQRLLSVTSDNLRWKLSKWIQKNKNKKNRVIFPWKREDKFVL